MIGSTSTVQLTCVVLVWACGRDAPAATKVTIAIASAADAKCRVFPCASKSTSKNPNVVCAADCSRRIDRFHRRHRLALLPAASMVHAHLPPIEQNIFGLTPSCRYPMMNRLRCLLAAALTLLFAHAAGAAIAVDVNTSTDRTTAATTVTSPVFSTTAVNELLLAFIETDAPTTATTTVSGVAGGGLTWTLVSRANAEAGTAEIWRAFAPARLTGVSITATISRSVLSSITVMSFTGADTSGTNGSGAIGAVASKSAATGAPTASLLTSRSGSWVLAAGNDWDNPIARTPAVGESIVHQSLSASGDTYWVQKIDAPTSAPGTTVTVSDTSPTTDRYNPAGAEVLPASAAANTIMVALTSPGPGNLTATVNVSASASGTTSTIAGVQFQLDNVNLGSMIAAAPYTLAWDTTTTSDGPHSLTAVALDGAGGQASSAPVVVTIINGAALSGQWSTP